MPLVISDIGIHDGTGTHGGARTRRNRAKHTKTKRKRKQITHRRNNKKRK